MDKHEFAVWSEANRKKKIAEHRAKHASSGLCKGLTDKEWKKATVSQKSSFAKSRKHSHTSVWKHYAVTNKEVQIKYG